MQWEWFSQLGGILTNALSGEVDSKDRKEEERGEKGREREGEKNVVSKEECESLGVNERVVEAVEGMCSHPSTWTSFPNIEMFARLRLTHAQKRHARCALKVIPSLRKMRKTICPRVTHTHSHTHARTHSYTHSRIYTPIPFTECE